jgi:hypothetical protein
MVYSRQLSRLTRSHGNEEGILSRSAKDASIVFSRDV